MKRRITAAVVVALAMGFSVGAYAAESVKPYAHTNSKGKTYYLFSKDIQLKNSDKVRTIYYFAKDPNNKKGKPMPAVPADREVSETKSGMLVLKKKHAAEDAKDKQGPGDRDP